jgi:ATP-dependent DNA ligase
METTDLYRINAKKQVQIWSIVKTHNGFTLEYGALNGELQYKDVEVVCNQSGRSFKEQQELEYQSRINDQLANGYKRTIAEAEANAGKNELNFYRPMLAQPLANQMLSPDRYYAQPKYDGNRCIDELTEVLTEFGYVKFKDLEGTNIQVLSYNEVSKKLEYKQILDTIRYEFSSPKDWVRLKSIGRTTINEHWLTVTRDHKVFTNEGWVEAGSLKHQLIGRQCASREQISVLLGILLGDGHCRKDFVVSYSQKHLDNILHKRAILGIGNKIGHHISGYGSEIYYSSLTKRDLESVSYPIETFYKDGKRVIEYELLKDIFDYNTFSVWYADDGSLRYNNGNVQTPVMTICISRYTREEAEVFVKLLANIGVIATINGAGKSLMLRISTEQTLTHMEKLNELVVEGVEYKYTNVKSYMPIYEFKLEYNEVIVDNIQTTSHKQRCDITVEDNHNFFTRHGLVHNCLITNHNGKVIAYSRNGKVIDTIDHIANNIKIPEGVTLDGELYLHGVPLQTIMSWTKKKQPDTERLQYFCFDVIMDKPMADRRRLIREVELASDNVISAPTHDLAVEDMWELFYHYKARKYEGLILRHKDYGYEAGKRSKGLLKLKTWEDAEFKVVKIEPSKDGYAILYCETDTGKVFKVTAPGTVSEKAGILMNSDKYIGQYITIQYANLTPGGSPFHPVAKGWRDLDD